VRDYTKNRVVLLLKEKERMNRLEVLYEQDVKKIAFTVRKTDLHADKLILKGPRHSGKTYLILDLLSSFKKEQFLYIDFADVRIDASIAAHLEDFLKRYPKIELLVLENLDFAFPLPSCKRIIITTSQRDFHLQGFEELFLYPLDFEEFIAFDKKGSDAEQIFGQYANIGTFPGMIGVSKFAFVQSFQQLLHSFYTTPVELEILKTYTLRQSTLVSVYAMFNLVKKHHKISKDKFYAYTHKLLNEEVIFMVEKFGQKSTQKKLYMIDFAMRGVLSFEKDFIRRFENMIFLELYKRGMDIYYADWIDFYLPKSDTAVFSAPFMTRELLEKKLQKAKKGFETLNVKQVHVVTMGMQEQFEEEGVTYEVLPFWNWAVQI
jgi:predicted AAA+ superfamily ATPase